MYPYQIYQALTDQRRRDLMAEVRHRELVRTARQGPGSPSRPTSRIRQSSARILALLRVVGGTRASSGETSAASAGAGGQSSPMGCIA
jgi:hypothetical protein